MQLKPQLRIRLILTFILFLGSIGTAHFYLWAFMDLNAEVLIALSIGGGCQAAMTLLLASLINKDCIVAEFIFSLFYGIITVYTFNLCVKFLTPDDAAWECTIGMYVVCIALPLSFILWIADFLLNVKDLYEQYKQY